MSHPIPTHDYDEEKLYEEQYETPIAEEKKKEDALEAPMRQAIVQGIFTL